MEFRTFPNTDLKVSVLAQGTWAIGGPWAHGWGEVNDQDSIRTIRHAIDAGINFIDTANVYGLGHAEEIIGEAIQGQRDKVVIATKFAAIVSPNGDIAWDATPKHMAEECEKSLKRMQTDYLDILAIHWPLADTPMEETMGGFQQLIDQGKIRYAGVCNFTKANLEEALKYGKLVSHQLRYNMLERDNEAEVIPYCIEKGIGLQVYGPLAHGLLAGEFKKGDILKPEDWRSRYTLFEKPIFDKIMGLLEKLQPIAVAHQCKLADLALAWILSRPGVTTALVGMMQPWQVDENIKSIELKLNSAEFKEMEKLIEEADLGLRILNPDEYMDKTTK